MKTAEDAEDAEEFCAFGQCLLCALGVLCGFHFARG